MSVLCRVCLVFPPLVSLFGLIPVLVEWLLVHSCPSVFVSLSMIILCIYSHVCSVRFRLVYSLLPGVPVCVSLALSCPALVGYIKDCYFELHPRLRVPRSSLVCAHWQVTRSVKLSSHDFLFHRIINMRNTKPKFPYHPSQWGKT